VAGYRAHRVQKAHLSPQKTPAVTRPQRQLSTPTPQPRESRQGSEERTSEAPILKSGTPKQHACYRPSAAPKIRATKNTQWNQGPSHTGLTTFVGVFRQNFEKSNANPMKSRT